MDQSAQIVDVLARSVDRDPQVLDRVLFAARALEESLQRLLSSHELLHLSLVGLLLLLNIRNALDEGQPPSDGILQPLQIEHFALDPDVSILERTLPIGILKTILSETNIHLRLS